MPAFELRDGITDSDTIASLKKTLTWLLANLDDSNVKRLVTEYCKIQSENGETELSGPQFIMKDATGTIRLVIGYDKTDNKFIFSLVNAAGTPTVGINDDGNAMFTGEITGSSIVGSTIQTAPLGQERIELKADGLTSYNAAGLKEGAAIEGGLYGFSQLVLYVAGLLKGGLSAGEYDALQLSAENGNSLFIVSSGSNDRFVANFNCNLATFSNMRDGNEDFYASQPWVGSYVNSQGFLKSTSGWSGYMNGADGSMYTVSNGLIIDKIL
jgi:hypothetical protein